MRANRLTALGFEVAGSCSLDKRLRSGVRFTTTRHQHERVIYAFAVDGNVKYIGVCDNTRTRFGTRMARYQGMTGAGTNKRVAGLLKRVLSRGSTVRILAWQPGRVVRVGDLRVDLVKGLENPLIALAAPEWNIHR